MQVNILAVVLRSVDIFAIFGNFISIVVWKVGKKSKLASCSTYMISLAVADIIILLNSGVLYIVTGGNITDREKRQVVLNSNNFFCKFVLYSVMVSIQVSAWITVVIAVERMLLLTLPVKMHNCVTSTKRRGVIVPCLIMFISLGLNMAELIIPEIRQVKSGNTTVLVCTGNKIYTTMHSVSCAFFTALIPLFSLVVCNL